MPAPGGFPAAALACLLLPVAGGFALAAGGSRALSKGRIVEPTGNVLQPYRVLSSCPAGTQPKKTDRPMKGDMRCVKGGERTTPGILVPWDDLFQPYILISRCPDGTHPVRSDWPLKGDRTCAKDKGAPPAIYLHTDDKSEPVMRVPVCPAGMHEKVTGWPGKGDMGCEWDKKEAPAAAETPAKTPARGDGKDELVPWSPAEGTP